MAHPETPRHQPEAGGGMFWFLEIAAQLITCSSCCWSHLVQAGLIVRARRGPFEPHAQLSQGRDFKNRSGRSFCHFAEDGKQSEIDLRTASRVGAAGRASACAPLYVPPTPSLAISDDGYADGCRRRDSYPRAQVRTGPYPIGTSVAQPRVGLLHLSEQFLEAFPHVLVHDLPRTRRVASSSHRVMPSCGPTVPRWWRPGFRPVSDYGRHLVPTVSGESDSMDSVARQRFSATCTPSSSNPVSTETT